MALFTHMQSRLRNILGLMVVLLFAASCANQAGFGTGARGINANTPVKVALLVPLETGDGQKDAVGSSLVNAARMARGDLAGVQMDLQVYPTAAEPARAQAAVQRAIAEGAQVIVGPLFTTTTAAVQPIAAQNGLQVLSFSNNTQVAGNNVYLLGVTFDTVADRVVSYAVGQGKSQIAVVHADDPAGAVGLTAATNSIQRYGASFAGSTSYEVTPQGVSEAAPLIAEGVKGSGANAVVFTDSPGGALTFLTPMLANSELSSSDVQFLGLTRWNEPAAAAQTPSMQGGVFAAPDPALVAQFNARYTSVYGSDPHPLAGLAYDGIAAVGAMIRGAQASGASTALTQQQITDARGFAGVNGIFRFNANGTADRGLALLQLRSGEAIVIDPAPRAFGAGS